MSPDPRAIAAAFQRDGVYLARAVFDAETIARLEADFDRIVTQLVESGEPIDATWTTADREPDQVVLHTHNVQNFSSNWLDAVTDPRFVDIAEAILGDDIVLHHSKLFQKPPGHGSPFPMHQDWRYFPITDNRMIAAIIHLSPATAEMGCVSAFPGSHRLGRLPSASGQPDYDDPDEFRAVAEQYPISEATTYEAEPGDVLFISCLTIHGSGPNLSPDVRKTVLVQMYDGAAALEESNHPVAGSVLRGWNHHATRASAGGGNAELAKSFVDACNCRDLSRMEGFLGTDARHVVDGQETDGGPAGFRELYRRLSDTDAQITIAELASADDLVFLEEVTEGRLPDGAGYRMAAAVRQRWVNGRLVEHRSYPDPPVVDGGTVSVEEFLRRSGAAAD